MLGFVLGAHGTLGEAIGYVALIGVPALVIGLGVFSRAAGVSGWIGVATFGWLATLELFYGRSAAVGDQNRYSSLAALTWLGFAALMLFAIREVGNRLAARHQARTRCPRSTSPWVALAVVVPLFLAAVGAGRDHASAMPPPQYDAGVAGDRTAPRTDRQLEIPVRRIRRRRPSITDLLIETGHYPFVDSWDLDCGLLGHSTSTFPVAATNPTIRARCSPATPVPRLPGAVEITGRVIDDRPIHCIVITNDEDVVVGAATI